ncbi:ADP-ribosylglycohydrolase family protein [Trichormus azollae]|jgi:ADP-ribosylglycohydrolase|uniref:ADP-ribosylglycohydrolase family protein n=1 Tax=Trichormus azollae TaxID=1164 RepID=UPI0001956C2B|nr:ADP-ribosylglycohydrolase family protein [Trichormus azollae]
MLLELAIGDAYGAGFEYANEMIFANDLSRYIKHPRHRLIPGSYTDDTQMSMAIAETIVFQGSWAPEVLAENFVNAFKRDPREGYASRFYDFLVSIQYGKEFLAKIYSGSDKSGAAMRAAPIGLYSTPEKVVALMYHCFIYQLGNKSALGKFIESYMPGGCSQPWQGKVKTAARRFSEVGQKVSVP